LEIETVVWKNKKTIVEILKKNLPPYAHTHGFITFDFYQSITEYPYVQVFETTTSSMGFFLNCLALLPEVQQKVFEEDRKIQQLLNGREITLQDLQMYEYTERAIKESMRIFPVGPILGRKTTKNVNFGKEKTN